MVERFGPSLSRVAATYVGPGADREDLLQEMALALVVALPAFRGESSERTYVFRVAHNCGMRFVGRRGRRLGVPFEEEHDLGKPAHQEHEVLHAQRRARLEVALRDLPLGLRQVMSLALEGLSIKEIAESLAIAENAVSVRLHRASAALREKVGR